MDTDFNPAKLEAELSPEEKRVERWRPIKGSEVYEVSDMGRVRSWWNRGGSGKRGMGKKARVLALRISNHGYVKVRLYTCDAKAGREEWVHRLVLEVFVGEPEGEQQAHHRDSRITNNRLSNLEWLGARDNCQEREKAKKEASDGRP